MDYCAYICASIAGLVLFCIGLIGLTGTPHALSPAATLLLQPMGYGESLERYYYIALIVIGVWLVLYLQARIAAMLALVLVLAKIALV